MVQKCGETVAVAERSGAKMGLKSALTGTQGDREGVPGGTEPV